MLRAVPAAILRAGGGGGAGAELLEPCAAAEREPWGWGRTPACGVGRGTRGEDTRGDSDTGGDGGEEERTGEGRGEEGARPRPAGPPLTKWRRGVGGGGAALRGAGSRPPSALSGRRCGGTGNVQSRYWFQCRYPIVKPGQ